MDPHHGGFAALRGDLNAAVQCAVVDGQGVVTNIEINPVDFGINSHVTGLIFLRVAATDFVEVFAPGVKPIRGFVLTTAICAGT